MAVGLWFLGETEGASGTTPASAPRIASGTLLGSCLSFSRASFELSRTLEPLDWVLGSDLFLWLADSQKCCCLRYDYHDIVVL